MKKLIVTLIIFISFMSCKQEQQMGPREISKVGIDTIFPWKKDSLKFSIRAIELSEEHLWYAGSNGSYGMISLEGGDFGYGKVKKTDTTDYGLRSSAIINDSYFVLTIENPAIITKYDFDHSNPVNSKSRPVYKEEHEKAFYDSMDFWNDLEGIAIGDPTEDCMSILITRDGGETWNKLSCDDLPKAKDGEAAFAASDSNIAIVGDNTWVATGGKTSRVIYSPDKGTTWEVFETPIVQGLETTGMYSIDFYDELKGYAIGGDYTKPDDNTANKILTNDGGKTWELVAQGQEPGYRSCVQYVPNRGGKELVAIGFKGIDYSNDGGHNWKHLSDEGFYTIRFLNDSIAYAAGRGRISKLTFK